MQPAARNENLFTNLNLPIKESIVQDVPPLFEDSECALYVLKDALQVGH